VLLVLPLGTRPALARTMTEPTDDPLLWLEQVQGEQALAWVHERNAESLAALSREPGFGPLRERIRAILDSRAQIPTVVRRGAHLWNLWQDAANPRGLWRRTTLAEYRKAEPAWEIVLDLDALAAREGVNWVWKGADVLGPGYRHALLQLSRGGADAVEVREFDIDERRFVAGGFVLPEAKTETAWLDADTVLVGTDFGAGSLTDSGYPRVVKRWRRGRPLADAETVFEVERGDVAAWFAVDATPGFERTLLWRAVDFYTTKTFLLETGGPREVPHPADAKFSFWRDQVVVELRSPWAVAGATFERGSLLVGDAAAYLRGERTLQPLFVPDDHRSLEAWTTTRTTVVLTLLEDVTARLEECSRDTAGRWQRRVVKAPSPGTLGVQSLHDPLFESAPGQRETAGASQPGASSPAEPDRPAADPLAEALLVRYADFLTPDTLLLGRTGSDEREVLKSRPSYFDAAEMRAEQRFATSRDGSRVPYFVVWPRSPRADGRNPTLLYAYGGFEVSLAPSYSGSLGAAWLEQGGVYVLANIRGGGEYGPAWHQAALKEKRQNAFDDLAAVAGDLVRTGITRPAQLGIMGGSNGGLLVGAVMLQRPELFGAVVCQVPLLDMRRYHRLLAGASWMAEYGDPDQPDDWAWLSRYSPYHNVRAGTALPPLLLTTSTRDDRVHPGHARKMAEKMRSQGHRVLYYENVEGGHAAAADNAQRALMMALEYTFLRRELA